MIHTRGLLNEGPSTLTYSFYLRNYTFFFTAQEKISTPHAQPCCLYSHNLIAPSSPPVARTGRVLCHRTTLTSPSCAL